VEVGGGASDAWDGAKDFYSNNREVIEVAAACVVIVGLTALAVKTLGASTTVTSSGYAAAFATLATAFA